MKRILKITILLMAVLLLAGCSGQSREDEELITITLPESLHKYCGKTADEVYASLLNAGEEYYTEAEVRGEDLILRMTEEQRQFHIKENNEYIEELLSVLYEADPAYRFEGDENYVNLTYYFDENISDFTDTQAVYAVSCMYAMNYILENNTTDWHVHIEIYNCHNGNLVVDMDLPEETVVIGPKQWEASYEE